MIHYSLFINIPGFSPIAHPAPLAALGLTNLGSFLSAVYNIAIYLAAFMAFFWLIWGAFQYLTAKGNKEGLAKARSRIFWALIGLVIVLLSLIIAQFASQVFPPSPGTRPIPI